VRYDPDAVDRSALLESARDFARTRVPSLAGGAAVLAVSGGGDSVAMASLLVEAGVARPELCVVAWFDHRLRGEAESSHERAAVTSLCERYHLRMVEGAWDAPESVEAAARDARYRFLAGVALENRIDVIATAHTEDDHVETLVMRQMRGTGAWGLRGILPEREQIVEHTPPHELRDDATASAHAPLVIARPVLGCARAELRAWCEARNLTYVDDPTNDDRRFLRNRVRHEILPQLEAASPDARERLLAGAAAAAASVDALDGVAREALLLPMTEIAAPHVALERRILLGLADDAAVHAYRLAISSLLGDAREFGCAAYETMLHAPRGATGAAYELPRGIILTVDSGAVIVSRGPLDVAAIGHEESHAAPWAGSIGAWRLNVTDAPPGAVVRGRRPGDRVRTRGGTKKLQDVYVDEKVPRRDRAAAPVVAVGNHVLWSAACDVRSARAGAVVAEAQRLASSVSAVAHRDSGG
jgi:tRNA(Ile)-lysidine synthetase-like protein